MATSIPSRQQANYGRTQKPSLPITMPIRKSAYQMPKSRAANASPPEYDDRSTLSGRSSQSGGTFSDIRTERSGKSSRRSRDSEYINSIDLDDELAERFSGAMNTFNLDKSIARQAQTSGSINAEARELAEFQAQAVAQMNRLKVKFADVTDSYAEAREDIAITRKLNADNKARASRLQRDRESEVASSSRSRTVRR